jgi:hypothetical protein
MFLEIHYIDIRSQINKMFAPLNFWKRDLHTCEIIEVGGQRSIWHFWSYFIYKGRIKSFLCHQIPGEEHF